MMLRDAIETFDGITRLANASAARRARLRSSWSEGSDSEAHAVLLTVPHGKAF
jgi:hypothetical protein